MMDEGDVRPVPDPTRLTTESLHREIAAVRELLESKIEVLHTQMMGHWTLDSERAAKIDEHFQALERVRLEQQAAAERTLNKSEQAINKQLDALANRVDDLRGRVSRAESVKIGGVEERTEHRAANAAVYALAGFIATLLVLGNLASAFFAFHK